ncbi:Dipeptidyl aminopeptidase BII [Luteimonas sp. 9C]|uniref:S46 family peptidase n=1 Tax=Luteimonas sp. 9C TaxID=2653148 RepID=UPI0012F04D19|nr:S46 family peptidase [Luteimonas sp. 9C]VXB87732.1 Dipeptidyl aminopeptidase BII [Luteimonas sp. 9C]
MRHPLLAATLLGVFFSCSAPAAMAGEGMWVPQQLPDIAPALRKAGLKLDPNRLADLTGDPLGAVVSLGGCTASFVSPQGLVLTNHHCAYGAIQLNSTPENNLMRDGFNAAALGDEISAGPNARIYALDSIQDVTAEVRAAIDAAPDGLGRTTALDTIEKTLVARCEADAAYRCRLYSFLGGNSYRLFRNLEIRDVRLVYAPAGGIGSFGGDVDNWMWPRHTGDFAFYRAYVGRDGRPADYAEDNIPYTPQRFLRLADKPLREKDFVMVAGYPGRTSRYAFADEFSETVAWRYPQIGRHYRALIDLVEARGKADPEIDVRYASAVRGWQNTLKNYEGQLQGFERVGALARKQAEEAAVLEWLRSRGDDGAAALDAHAKIVALDAQARATRERDLVLSLLDNSGLLSTANRLYRLSMEKEKPDAMREQGYQQRDLPAIEGGLKQMDRRFVAEMDRELTRYALMQYIQLPPEQRIAAIDTWLGGNDAAAIDRALDRLQRSVLANSDERLKWFAADRHAFLRSRDPALMYAAAVTPELLQIELASKARAGDLLQLRPTYLQAVADYRASRKEAVYPDANSSLRLTFGNVMGYTNLAGAQQTPFTRLDEIPPKATGAEPFDAPKAQLNAIAADRDGGLADRRLRSVPVNFLSDLDVTGGNSGSPVLDADGRLTGLLFDMTWEAVVSNWVFDPAMTRTISVDQRYIRWVMQEVEPAPRLLQEMGASAR